MSHKKKHPLCVVCKVECPRVEAKYCCRKCCEQDFKGRHLGRPAKPALPCLICGKPRKNKYNKGFCGLVCWNQSLRLKKIQLWKEGKFSGVIGTYGTGFSKIIRNYMLEKFNYTCSICGWNKHHPDGSSPLHINHKNGKHNDNREENLEVLCPNCHSLTLTYGARNKGHSTRKFRYYRAPKKSALLV